MKFLFKSLILFLLFIVSLILFFPKNQIFYLLEEKLQTKDIIVSDEIRNSKFFSFEIKGANIYFQNLLTANIKDINITSFILFSKIEAKQILISKSFEQFLPNKIDEISLTYSISDFKNILINAKGEFGTFSGNIDVVSNVLKGELEASSLMKSKYRNLLTQFKLENGKYKYEQKL